MVSDSHSIAIIITGASRGFGRALAIVANDAFGGNSKLILIARSTTGLQETISNFPHRPSERCCYHSMDLGNLEELDLNIEIIIKDLEEASRIILFQNAGTIGHLGLSRDSPSLKDMKGNVDLNITSCLWLSTRMTHYARATFKDLVIVNVSSLVAIVDFPTLGIYSVAKAARDKYHALIAREEEGSSHASECRGIIRTLNYAPGPLETDMVKEIRTNLDKVDRSLRKAYTKVQLNPLDSARKIFSLLERDDFESGSHVDYYDLPEDA